MAVIEKDKAIVPLTERPLARFEPFFTEWPMRSPFGLLDRVRDEMNRIFEGFGVPHVPAKIENLWMPRVELFERKGELVVRADLPGLNKDDIKVEVTEEGLVLEGERKLEEKEEKENYYRSERETGSFFRTIPLPEGIKVDQVTATFVDGVLEVKVPLPVAKPAATKIAITEATAKAA